MTPEPGTSEHWDYWQARIAAKIAQTTQSLLAEEREHHRLRAVNHGHRFGRDRKCPCGLSQKDYHLAPISQRQPACQAEHPSTTP